MRVFSFTAIFVAALFQTASAKEKPNFLFILADDLGWADTTLYGHTQLYETPNLERLAARGMTFDRAYTASPLCSPTRSSILTGLHPARTGLTAPNCHTPKVVLEASAGETGPPHQKLTSYTSVTRLDPEYDTLAELLRKDGYKTAHFGKWHLGKAPYSPLEHGFDIDIPNWHGPGPAGSFIAPWKFENFTENYPQEHIEDRMGDEAVSFLEKHKDEPFFLNYWQFSVHAPFDAKRELIEKYREKIDPEDEQRSPTYAAMVQSLDENVGKMLDALDRLDLSTNTVIVFYSDNGGNMYNEIDGTTPTSNRPLRGGKANNWDGGVRVPAIVVWPGVTEPGSRNKDLITSTDFFPTLLAMAGIALPGKLPLDGVDISPLLRGESIGRDAIYTFFPHSTKVPDTLPPSASIYSGDWKLLRLLHNGEKGKHEDRLFNLVEDIGESKDIASANPDMAKEMAQKLDRFLERTAAVYHRPNPNYDIKSAMLRTNGIVAGKHALLSIQGSRLLLELEGENPQVNLQFPSSIPPGELKLTIMGTSTDQGRLDLRWAEKGVKPLYFRDRLKSSQAYPANEAFAIDVPFTPGKPVPSVRIDFRQKKGSVRIDQILVSRGGKAVWKTKWGSNN